MRNKILDISGKEMIALGGPFMHKQFIKGDIVVELTWIDEEPHMLLYRAVPKSKTGVMKIDLNDAYKYADSRTGGPSKTLFDDCVIGAKAIGFAAMDSFAIRGLMDAILDHLDDLIQMPPEPQGSALANAPTTGDNELAIKIDGQTVLEAMV